MSTWVDNPNAQISGGLLFGQLAGHLISDPAVSDMVDAQSATFADRNIYISTHDYSMSGLTSTATMQAMLDTTGLGHLCTPMVAALGELNFGTPDPGWPVLGCAAFSNGSMDSTLQALCDQFNTLPAKPILFRPWREMNSTIAPWGSSGSINGGVNETSGPAGTYVTGWKYVVNFIRARCDWVRFLWCPACINGQILSDMSQWYPGDDYVDWNGCDGYINNPSLKTLNFIFSPWYGGFNSLSGSVSRKPAMICETQIDQNDPSRATDYAQYTADFGSGGAFGEGIYAVNFWNGGNSSAQYRIEDAPAGSLAAYQTMVGSAPFLGVPVDTPNLRVLERANEVIVVSA